ncbi:LOB domain-containing protein 33 [Camellia lanceoleosa]|uniref:LOB domain-containing protein 33 n=1 Tax=Camellia lanceoleosa TaxID=1840588 RepID=A0ACC0IPA8_9ERIC|nr:LOB domain-containing protein 33 [Camellia lanceoleosa]
MTGLGSSCGACKFLRRRSTSECVFAPYFNYNEAAAHFAVVHKVFGSSNVSELLTTHPMNDRREAAITISYEVLTQMHDPIYGCVSPMFDLQQQVASLQEEIETLGIQMANLTVDVSSCGLILSHSHLVLQHIVSIILTMNSSITSVKFCRFSSDNFSVNLCKILRILGLVLYLAEFH